MGAGAVGAGAVQSLRVVPCHMKHSEQSESTSVGTSSSRVRSQTEESSTNLAGTMTGYNQGKLVRTMINPLAAEAGLDFHLDWEELEEDDASSNVASRECAELSRPISPEVKVAEYRRSIRRIITHALASEASLDLHLEWEDDTCTSDSIEALWPEVEHGSCVSSNHRISTHSFVADAGLELRLDLKEEKTCANARGSMAAFVALAALSVSSIIVTMIDLRAAIAV